MIHRLTYICWTFLILLVLTACDGFLGNKTDTEFLDEPVFEDQTVAYVPIQPVLDGFTYPVDIIAGFDELIYVADQGTEEIISFDQAGNETGRFRVPGLTGIAQDRQLDIIAVGTRDTTISSTNFTLPAIYRIDLNKSGPYGLANASIKNIITHPFYFKSGTPTASDEIISFQDVAIWPDNRYYVTRNGPSNASTQFGGPDDAIILFNAADEFVSPIFVSTTLGLFTDYFKKPSGIATFVNAPQSLELNNPGLTPPGDFYFTSIAPSNALKVQRINFVQTEFGSSYSLTQQLVGDTSRADRFLYEANRFNEPTDIAIAGDGTRYVFVVDASRDSLYQFSADGFEGVSPPTGANSTKAIRASFGGTGEGLRQFNEPRGVAYFDRIVYVADAGNGRILRFKLTTDFE